MSNSFVNRAVVTLSPSSGATTTHTFTYTPLGTAAQGYVLTLYVLMIGASKTFTACTGTGVTTVGFSTTLNDTTNGATFITWVGQCSSAGSAVTFTITTSSLDASTAMSVVISEFATDFANPSWALASTSNAINQASSATWTTSALSVQRGDLAYCNFSALVANPTSAGPPASPDPLCWYPGALLMVVGGAYPSPTVATLATITQFGAAALNTNASYIMQLGVNPAEKFEAQTILLRPGGIDPAAKRTVVSGYGGIF